MRVTAKVRFKPNQEVMDKLETTAKKNALTLTADWVLSEVVKSGKVPKDTGDLERSGFVKVIQDNIVLVVFDTPYARRWYFNSEGATFRTEYNANATDHWMDDFIHGDRKSDLLETFTDFYRDELKGLIR